MGGEYGVRIPKESARHSSTKTLLKLLPSLFLLKMEEILAKKGQRLAIATISWSAYCLSHKFVERHVWLNIR